MGMGIFAVLVFGVHFSRCVSLVCRIGMVSGILASVFIILDELADMQVLPIPQSIQSVLAILTFVLYGVALLTVIDRRYEFSNK